MIDKKSVEVAINLVRPGFIQDGGDIELIAVDEGKGTVTIKLVGHCSSCFMSTNHLEQTLAIQLKDLVPEITELIVE